MAILLLGYLEVIEAVRKEQCIYYYLKGLNAYRHTDCRYFEKELDPYESVSFAITEMQNKTT